MRTKLQKWAENLQREVYEEWKSKYHFWKAGFKVFYGPVCKRPRLMIISQNPGGNYKSFRREDKSRFESGDFSLPQTTPYSSNHKISKKMQNFFEQNKNLLETSVTFPVIFFRSKDTKKLRAMGRFRRYEMEHFCFKKVKEIIEEIRPRFILVAGLHTYTKLREIFGLFDTEEFKRYKKGRVVAIESQGRGIKVFTMIHPTGARINNKEWGYLRELFWKSFDNQVHLTKELLWLQ